MIRSRPVIKYSWHRIFNFLSFVLLWLAIPALGGGIALMEQSVKEMGQAFSGAPTNFSDASTVFFNPAAMSQSEGRLLSVAGYVIAPSVNFHNDNSHFGPASRGFLLLGNNGKNAGSWVFIPNIYYVHPLTGAIQYRWLAA